MTEESIVEFVGDMVHKWYPHDVVVEFEKAEAMWEVSQNCGFLYPEPVELREEDSIIISRNLSAHETWFPMRDIYLDYMTGATPTADLLGVFAEAGRVLAAIHENLELPDPVTWVPEPEFRDSLQRGGPGGEGYGALPSVFLHCDYGFTNVLWSRGSGMIATWDSSRDGYSTFNTGLIGPAYVDLGQFQSCLEGRVALRRYPSIKWDRLGDVRAAFLDAYDEAAGVTVDRDWVRGFGYAVADANYRQRLPRSKLAQKAAGKVLYNRFKGNVL
jgi:hypothetical protein